MSLLDRINSQKTQLNQMIIILDAMAKRNAPEYQINKVKSEINRFQLNLSNLHKEFWGSK